LISAIYADPKEVKRQRDREYYARNKDEISKRRRQARELKKLASSSQPVDDENTTPVALQSGVTHLSNIIPAGGHRFLTRNIFDVCFPKAKLCMEYSFIFCTVFVGPDPNVQPTYASEIPHLHSVQTYEYGAPNLTAGTIICDIMLFVLHTNVAI
jgi:hypothetical protein